MPTEGPDPEGPGSGLVNTALRFLSIGCAGMTETGDNRDPLEVLAAEFTEQCRSGRRPSIAGYAEQHPELAGEIRELFPTIAAIEQVKSATSQSSSAGPVRGDVKLERLGDFRIIRELGRGGMGIVYEAQQESLCRRVAIKVLPRQALLNPRQLERFEHEARTAAKLHHTNIVPIFGVGEHEGYHYIVMQYINGVGLDEMARELRRLRHDTTALPRSHTAGPQSLSSLDVTGMARALVAAPPQTSDQVAPPTESDARAPIPARLGARYWRSIARMATQAANALAYAHDQGTLHRDIKPGNLILDADATVWVADFGLARAIDRDAMTQAGDVAGTLRYMAPESFKGHADVRGDVYSLGLTLYELATLEAAFADPQRTGVIDAIMSGRIRSPRSANPDVPRDLETIILKSIAHNPNDRYPSADALAADLRCFLDDRPIRARRVHVFERAWRWSRRNPSLAGAVGTAAMLLLAISVVSTVAYVQTREANRTARRALLGETRQRQRAEQTSDLALEALDAIFHEFAPRASISMGSTAASRSEDEEISVPVQPLLSKETASLLEHMLDFYRRLALLEGGDDSALQRKIADANRRVGDIHVQLGHFEEGRLAYARALATWQQLKADASEAAVIDLEIARIHNGIGRSHVAEDQPVQGQDAFLESLLILEPLAQPTQASPPFKFELARTLFLLGQAHRPPVPHVPQGRRRPPMRPRPPRGEFPFDGGTAPPPDSFAPPPDDVEGRREFLLDAIDLLTQLTGNHADVPDYRHLLALCHRELASPGVGFGKESAEGGLKRAIEILELLAGDFPRVARYRFDLSQAYALQTLRTHSSAEVPRLEVARRLRKAVALGEELVFEHPHMPAYVLSLAQSHHKLADVFQQSGQFESAEQCLRRAIALQTGLADQFPDAMPYQVAAALYRTSLAGLLLELDRLLAAEEQLESANAILEAAGADAPALLYVEDLSERCRRVLAEVRRRMADDG